MITFGIYDDLRARRRDGKFLHNRDCSRISSMPAKSTLAFIEPQRCLLVQNLPEGEDWLYEIKWDGFRAVGIVEGRKARLLSRNDKSLAADFPEVVSDLAKLKCKSAIVDGEIVAFDEEGRPAFQLLQNRKNRTAEVRLVLFDLMHLDGEDLTSLPLKTRRQKLKRVLLKPLGRLMFSGDLVGDPDALIAAAQAAGLEGVIAKRRDGPYLPGDRKGSWVKRKTEEVESFIIGGYIPNGRDFEELVVGQREGKLLRYVASVRAGFVPKTRAEVMAQIKPLVTNGCPFCNLPEEGKARWGRSLDAEKMKECRWVKPTIKVKVAFVEWTEADHLRHSRFVEI